MQGRPLRRSIRNTVAISDFASLNSRLPIYARGSRIATISLRRLKMPLNI